MSSTDELNTQIFFTGPKVHMRHDDKISFVAIDLLYDAKTEMFANNMGFIISSSREDDTTNKENYILKLEVAGLPYLRNGKLRITHQIAPTLGRCTRILAIDSHKKVGCFDTGFVTPISDFGDGKTFNFDVRGSKKHPFIDGIDAQLYNYDDQIGFWQRQDLGIDVFGDDVSEITMFHVPLSRNDKQQPSVVLFGTETGQIVFVDHHREDKKIFWMHQDSAKQPITRIKIIYEPDGKPNVVYTNSSPNLQMLDYSTGQSCNQNWICDRKPEAEQLDFVQVGPMIVSCGRKCTIGSWLYKQI